MEERILEEHEELLDKHEYKLENVQQDLIDIKTRLGIKDLTNGQVVEYQKGMVKFLEAERNERKEQDQFIREDLQKMDDKIWYIVTGIILMVLLEIGLFLFQLSIN